MANLYESLDNAQKGEAIAVLGREFGLTPAQTEAALTALLPAISAGLKKSTATVDGLGDMFAVMGQQSHLYALYDDAQTALGPQGLAAGKDAASFIFGSPDAVQALAGEAQKFSGVSSSILQKMLPVLAGLALSGLMRSKSSAQPVPVPAPAAPNSSSGDMGGLGDILGQIFGRGTPAAPAGPAPQVPSSPPPVPAGTDPQTIPGGDLLGTILREVAKGIQNGTIKPVIIGGGGPIQMPMPGGQAPSSPGVPQQVPGGDIFGEILRNVLGGALGGGDARMPRGGGAQTPQSPMKDLSDLTKQLGVMGGAGAAVFGDQFEHGQDVEQSRLENIQGILDRSSGTRRR
jgi:Bacterial protein of unknown function (DUF937)